MCAPVLKSKTNSSFCHTFYGIGLCDRQGLYATHHVEAQVCVCVCEVQIGNLSRIENSKSPDKPSYTIVSDAECATLCTRVWSILCVFSFIYFFFDFSLTYFE